MVDNVVESQVRVEREEEEEEGREGESDPVLHSFSALVAFLLEAEGDEESTPCLPSASLVDPSVLAETPGGAEEEGSIGGG